MSTQFLAPVLQGRTRTSSTTRCVRAASTSSSGRSGSRSSSRSRSHAAKARGEALDHVLLVGPPGLGKTSLALHRRARSSASGIRTVAGPALERKGDLAAILTGARAARRALRRRDPPAEPGDRGDPLPGARGLPARHHRRPGAGRAHAHARPAALHARRRDDAHGPAHDAAARPLRHDVPARLLRARRSSAIIVRRSARILGVEIEDEAADEIARRSRGTPRIANRILRRVRDVAEVRHDGAITTAIAREALDAARGRRRRARADRPRAPPRDRRALRRRPRRPLDARGRARRGARHDRRRLRAVPAPARLPPAHAARPRSSPSSAASTSAPRSRPAPLF